MSDKNKSVTENGPKATDGLGIEKEEVKAPYEKIRNEKKVLEGIMKNIKAGLAYLDTNFNFVAVNPIYCSSCGRTEEELLGKNYFTFFPGEENRLLFEKIKKTKEQIEISQKPIISENSLLKDVTFWDCTISPLKDSQENVYGLLICNIDVSERVKSINDLKTHGQKLENITSELRKVQMAVENASDIVFITDNKGKIIYINKAVKKISGYRQKDLLEKKPHFWMEYAPNKFFSQMWNSIYLLKKPFIGQIKERKKDGEIFEAEIKIAPVLDKNSQIISFVAIERDITEIKRLDAAKTEFISLAAHQLKGPLTNISLTAEMLLGGISGKMEKKSREYLDQIMDGIKKMSKMIELFLNVSRIEMKTFEIIPQPSDLKKIIEENIRAVLPQVINKKLELKKEICPDLPIINIDPRIMDIILDNLISNSIKYTAEGGIISITAERYRESILIRISDNGCGIPKDQQKNIFDKLFRATNVDKRIEGVGLGLYLCKSLISQSGGKIWLKSKKNKGTIFYISLPLQKRNKN